MGKHHGPIHRIRTVTPARVVVDWTAVYRGLPSPIVELPAVYQRWIECKCGRFRIGNDGSSAPYLAFQRHCAHPSDPAIHLVIDEG